MAARKKGKYNKEMVARITTCIEDDDYSIRDICDMVGIDESTYYDWFKKKKDFKLAVKEAEAKRFNKMVSLARAGLSVLLKGQEYEEITTEFANMPTGKKDENGAKVYKPIQVGIKKVKKKILPNLGAIKTVLFNHDRENFKEIVNNEISGLNGEPLKQEVVHVHSNVPLAENEDEIIE